MFPFGTLWGCLSHPKVFVVGKVVTANICVAEWLSGWWKIQGNMLEGKAQHLEEYNGGC
jgi:hypothetical protein